MDDTQSALAKRDAEWTLEPEAAVPPPAAPAVDLPPIGPAEIDRGEEGEQFTLRGVLVLITGLGVLMAVGRAVPIQVFAGVVGLLCLLTMALPSLVVGRHAGMVQIAWWLLLVIYLSAAGLAVWRG